MATACAMGMGASWNIANVGAVAEPVAAHYGVALATVGLFTTVLFVAELGSMAAIGRLVRRHGARLVGLGALALCAFGNLLILAVDGIVAALALRFVVGVGVGLAFVGGTTYVQNVGGGPLAQGLYGGLSLGTGGFAVAVVPSLAGPLGWQAPFLTALAAAVIAAPLVAAGPDARGASEIGAGFMRLLGDARVIRFAAVQAAAFGLAIVLSNWVVTLLARRGGYPEETAGLIGALILVIGILGRPAGGLYAHRHPERTRTLLAGAMILGAAGSLILGLAPPLAFALLGAAMLGLAGALPFGPTVAGLGRAFPASSGAAFGAMNAYALLMIVIGTPLVGLTFALPGKGLVGFAAAAAYWAFVIFVLPDRATLRQPRGSDVAPQARN
jgi:MFS family permease